MRRLMMALALVLSVATAATAEFVAQPADFRCLFDGVKVEGKNFYVFHKNKRKLRKAVRIAQRDLPNKRYPVGTVLQLFPLEAMVKRGGRFNREGGGWEWFRVAATASGSTIIARGGAEVVNVAGSCQTCHAAAAKFDFVCEGHAVASLGLNNQQIAAIQATDPRCK